MIKFDTEKQIISAHSEINELVYEVGFLIWSLNKNVAEVTGSENLFIRALLEVLQEVTVNDGRN